MKIQKAIQEKSKEKYFQSLEDILIFEIGASSNGIPAKTITLSPGVSFQLLFFADS